MEIRKLKQDEIEQTLEMGQFAFQHSMTEEEKADRRVNTIPENTWVAAENGALLSKLHIFPMNIFAGNKKLKMGGISGVATWPESRRGGLVKSLLHTSLVDMRERGHVFSFLYPFSVSFYRKFGWEMFADSYSWIVKRDQLPEKSGLKTGHIRRIPKEDWKTLQSVYEPFARSFNGMIDRDEQWWKYYTLKQKKGQIAVLTNADGQDAGYLIYEVKDNKMKISEMIGLDHQAKKQLWTFIANHDSMIEEVIVKTHANDSFRFFLPDPKVPEERSGYFMARVVDVKRLLEEFPFSLKEGERLQLGVEDSFCEWNDAVFTLSNQNDRKTVERGKESGADVIHMSINTLSSLVLGYLTPVEALSTGLLAGKEETVRQFTEILPEERPFIYDFF